VKRAAVLLLLPLAACSTPNPAAAPPNPPSQPSQPPVTASALSRPSSAAPPELSSSSLPVAPSPTRTAAAGRTATAARVPPPVTSSGALCHPRAVPGGVLPDAACTSGTANPDATQATIGSTICRAGYTATIRPPASYADALKRQQIVAYGYPDTDPRGYEEDHLIALELDGAPSDQRNLWPEPAHSPNPKDKVENVLRHRVCAGSLTLAEAQQRIATDWTTAAR